jgi:hypothetical protein
MRKHKPGACPDGRISVHNSDGAIIGHVGPHAVAGTVMRFGLKRPVLKNVNGKLQWHGQKTAVAPRRPAADRAHSLGSVPAKGR